MRNMMLGLVLTGYGMAPLSAAPVHGAKVDGLSIEAMHNFGGCVVGMTPAGAREVLAMDYRTEAYQEKLRRLAKGHDRCTRPGTSLKFSGVLFAGAMAESLLEQRRDGLSAASQVKSPLPARSSLEAMALCTVLTSPGQVSRLLATDVATDKETLAADALTTTLNACLSGADKAKLNQPALRSVLALAAWRIANAVDGTPSGASR